MRENKGRKHRHTHTQNWWVHLNCRCSFSGWHFKYTAECTCCSLTFIEVALNVHHISTHILHRSQVFVFSIYLLYIYLANDNLQLVSNNHYTTKNINFTWLKLHRGIHSDIYRERDTEREWERKICTKTSGYLHNILRYNEAHDGARPWKDTNNGIILNQN